MAPACVQSVSWGADMKPFFTATGRGFVRIGSRWMCRSRATSPAGPRSQDAVTAEPPTLAAAVVLLDRAPRSAADSPELRRGALGHPGRGGGAGREPARGCCTGSARGDRPGGGVGVPGRGVLPAAGAARPAVRFHGPRLGRRTPAVSYRRDQRGELVADRRSAGQHDRDGAPRHPRRCGRAARGRAGHLAGVDSAGRRVSRIAESAPAARPGPPWLSHRRRVPAPSAAERW